MKKKESQPTFKNLKKKEN